MGGLSHDQHLIVIMFVVRSLDELLHFPEIDWANLSKASRQVANWLTSTGLIQGSLWELTPGHFGGMLIENNYILCRGLFEEHISWKQWKESLSTMDMFRMMQEAECRRDDWPSIDALFESMVPILVSEVRESSQQWSRREP